MTEVIWSALQEAIVIVLVPGILWILILVLVSAIGLSLLWAVMILVRRIW